jgi:hypothetical protein
MASLNEIAYNIKNMAYGGGSTTGEETIGIRQIKFWIHYYRAQLIREEALKGKGIHHSFFQELLIRPTMDRRNNNSTDGILWGTYLDTYASTSEMLVYSERTANAAGITNPFVDYNDYYGKDFYDWHTDEEFADYGNIAIDLPDLIHVDGYGIRNLRIRKSNLSYNQNTATIDLPIVTYNEGVNKKYNRFTSKSPAAYIQHSADNIDVLIIDNLHSFLHNTDAGYVQPAQYRVYGSALYSDPTEFHGQNTGVQWNDDMQYPIPETLIPELNKRILMQEFNITKQTIDDRVDDNVDTTNVQQKVQRQVRQS